jgi:hypothetical protein
MSGPQGLKGSQGAKGSTGDLGVGVPGRNGAQGNTGMQGNLGNDGVQGKQGNQGQTGNRGDLGAQGNDAAGVQGNRGAQGNDAAGVQGIRGVQGNDAAGVQGGRGPLGDTGDKGAQGIIGFQGNDAAGVQGNVGPIGVQGVASMDLLLLNPLDNSLTFHFTQEQEQLVQFMNVDFNRGTKVLLMMCDVSTSVDGGNACDFEINLSLDTGPGVNARVCLDMSKANQAVSVIMKLNVYNVVVPDNTIVQARVKCNSPSLEHIVVQVSNFMLLELA